MQIAKVRAGARVAAAFFMAWLSGCAGAELLRTGRATYNEVINRTEDEQILGMIVRQRYDETYGLLAVASVTATLRAGASVGANAGVGPGSSYEGNLVPLSAGAVYEESPTISYVPLRGEQFIERMLAPLSAEQTLLLSRMNVAETEALRILIRRANGLANPIYASNAPAPGFDRFVTLYAGLREAGALDLVRTEPRGYAVLLHDANAEQATRMNELLALLGLPATAAARRETLVPLRFFVGGAERDGVDLETPSALEVIEAAGLGIELPARDVAEGIARGAALDPATRFLAVRSSDDRPENASVAVRYRGSWFFIDARDARSKQAFLLLRTLIGMRLDEGGAKGSPMLTLPVAR